MARPQKTRVICALPRHRCFAPTDVKHAETVVLTADEFEVLRLHDLEHLTQLEVASQMRIARTTVTSLLNSAHARLALAIVDGKKIVIEDGNCTVCEIGAACPKATGGGCSKQCRCRASCRYEQEQKK